MTRWKGQARGAALGYRIFLFVLRKFGLSPAYFLLRFVTLYFCFFSRGSNRSAYFYFRHVQGFSPLRSISSIYKNYYAFGQSIIDKYALLTGAGTDAFSYEHENISYLEEMQKSGEGGILISAHLGNWDIAGHLLDRLKGRINVVMYENEKRRLQELLGPILERRSFNIIGIGEGMEHLLEIREALGRGEFVCMHGDRFTEGVKTVETSLMGRKCRLPLGPFILAVKLKAPVSFVFSCKDSSRHYHFYSSEPQVYEGDGTRSAEGNVQGVLDDYTSYLESFMKSYPHQWFNFFPFWNEELDQHFEKAGKKGEHAKAESEEQIG